MGPKQAELRSAPVTREQRIKDMMMDLIYGERTKDTNRRSSWWLDKIARPMGFMAAPDTLDNADEVDAWKKANGIEPSKLDRASDYLTEAMLIGPGGARQLAKAGMRSGLGSGGWGSIDFLEPAMERLNKGANPASIWRDMGWGNQLPDLGGTSMPHYMGPYTAVDPRAIEINRGAFSPLTSDIANANKHVAGGRISDVFSWPEMEQALSQGGGKYKTAFSDLSIGDASAKPTLAPGVEASGLTNIPDPFMPLANRRQRGRGQRPALQYDDPYINNLTIRHDADMPVNLDDPENAVARAMKSTFAHEGGHIASTYEGLPNGATAVAGTRLGFVKPQYDWSPIAKDAKSKAIEIANSEGISADDIFRPFAQYGFDRPAMAGASKDLQKAVSNADRAATNSAYFNNPGEVAMRLGQSGMERGVHPSEWFTPGSVDPWNLSDIGNWNLRAQGWAPDTASIQDMMDRMRGLK